MLGSLLGGAAQVADWYAWLDVVVNAFAKGTLILLAGAALRIALRRSSASLRHSIGASVIVALLAIPILSTLLPTWEVPVWTDPPLHLPGSTQLSLAVNRPLKPPTSLSFPPPRDSLHSHPRHGESGLSAAPTTIVETPRKVTGRLPALSMAAYLILYWPLFLAGIWFAGAVFLLGRLFLAMGVVGWIVRRSHPARGPSFVHLTKNLSRRIALRREVQVVVSDQLDVALSLGLWRPVIILPKGALTWSRDRLRSILLHELAHVKRWDNVINVLGQVACAFYWPHPLVWWISSRVVVDRERSCDDLVLRHGTRASDYAGHLLEIARATLPLRRSLWRPLEVSQSSALKDRLKAILDRGRDRASAGVRGWAWTVLLIGLSFPLAALQPWVVHRPEGPSAEQRPHNPGNKRFAKPSEQKSGPSLFSNGPQSQRASFTSTAKPPSFGVAYRETSLTSSQLRRLARFEGADAPFLSARGYAERRQTPADTGLPLADHRLNFPRRDFLSSSGPHLPAPLPSQPLPENPPPEIPAPEPPITGPRPPDTGPGPPARPPDEGGDEGELERIELGSLGGTVGHTLIVNELGKAAGIADTADGEFRPFVWGPDDGMTDLGTLGGFGGSACLTPGCWHVSDSRVLDLNDRGHAVGISRTTDGETHGFFWSEDTGLIDVGTLGGNYSVAVEVNELGQVIGTSRNRNGLLRAFTWTPEDGIRDLGGPEDRQSEAKAINDHGHIVGVIDGRAFVWSPDHGMHRIGPERLFSQANAISSDGTIVGTAVFDESSIPRAFLWNSSQGLLDIGTLEGRFPASTALAVSDEGHVVGVATVIRDASAGLFEQRAFLWLPEAGHVEVVDLEGFGGRLDDFSPGLSVNDRGQVAGMGERDSTTGSRRAFVWTESDGRILLGDSEAEFDLSWAGSLNNLGEVGGATLIHDGVRRTLKAVIWRPKGHRRESVDLPILDDLGELLVEQLGADRGLLIALRTRLTVARLKLGRGQIRAAQVDIQRFAMMIDVGLQRGLIDPQVSNRLIGNLINADHRLNAPNGP